MRALQEQGVGRLFGSGTTTPDAVEYIRDWFRRARARPRDSPYMSELKHAALRIAPESPL
jgi:hypothetical protein